MKKTIKKLRHRITHESRLTWLTVAAAAPAAIVALILLWFGDHTPKVQWTLSLVMVMFWLGFALASALFVAAFLGLCGMRSLPAIAANVVIGTIGLLYLFVKVVYLPLPKGDGPFEALTLVLYRALRLF